MLSVLIQAILLAVSLCADCFAVSLCSGISLKSGIKCTSVIKIALAFALIQSGLLFVGWAFGHLLVGLLLKVSHIIAFLLLLYVGGSMLLEGIKGEENVRNLNGLKNVFIAGIATSIDALAVGAAKSMDGTGLSEVMPLLVSVFVVTFLSVVAGIFGGKQIGCSFGRWAEIAGGVVLIGIGASFLI